MKVPQHIGIIMDGNGRWANKRGLPRMMGHKAGVEALRRTLIACSDLGVKYLTIYVFSTENWGRPKTEVVALMALMELVRNEITELKKNNVKLTAIGDLDKLPAKSRKAIQQTMDATADSTGINLIMTINYGGRSEIVHAAKELARKAIENPELLESLDEKEFASHLYTAPYPDPELIIRTGGDFRISNFLLWQIAYSEIFVSETLWPDFAKPDLEAAIKDFSKRDRRFGKVKTAK